MVLYWNLVGLAGLVAGLTGYLMAVLVLQAAPGRRQNRRLALVLGLEATTAFFAGGLVFVVDHHDATYVVQAVGWLAFGVMNLAYLHFLATLDSPLTRPLRRRGVEIALMAGMAGFTALYLVQMEWFIADVAPGPLARYVGVPGPLHAPLLIVPTLPVLLFGLAAAVSMWLGAAPGSLARRQGASYALAFGIRDTAWLAFLAGTFLLSSELVAPWAFNAALTATYLVLAYGILRTQLFDIELKVKFAIEKSTVVALFAGLVFIASELVEQLLGVDQLVPAIIAASIVALAMRPIVRAGERVADRLMPGVEATPAYRRDRGLDVYRAALESAMVDGHVTDKERAMLVTLQERLGVPEEDARALERAAARSAG